MANGSRFANFYPTKIFPCAVLSRSFGICYIHKHVHLVLIYVCIIYIHRHVHTRMYKLSIFTVYHGSFGAEKFRGNLYMQTFATKLLILSLKSMFEKHHLELSYKKVLQTCKSTKTAKLFRLKTTTVYGPVYLFQYLLAYGHFSRRYVHTYI